jgi:hypothetical protein
MPTFDIPVFSPDAPLTGRRRSYKPSTSEDAVGKVIISAGAVGEEAAQRNFAFGRRMVKEGEEQIRYYDEQRKIRELSDAGDIAMEAILAVDADISSIERTSDPERMVEDGKASFDKHEKEALAKARRVSPAAEQLVLTKIRQAKITRIPQLGDKANALFVDREQARLLQRVEFAKEEIFRAEDPAVQQSLMTSLLAEVDMIGQKAIGPEKTQKLKQAIVKDIDVTGAKLAVQSDPDGMLNQLLRGPKANPHIPIDELPKLVEYASQAQRERFHFKEAQERKLERDTEKSQREAAEMALIQLRQGKLNPAGADAMLQRGEIAPEHHKMLVDVANAWRREAEATARMARAEVREAADRRDRQTDADLRMQVMLGKFTSKEQLAEYASSKKLNATAFDGAMTLLDAKTAATKHPDMAELTQAEQILKASFYKNQFEFSSDKHKQAYADLLNEISLATTPFGGTRKPLEYIQERLPVYLQSISQDRTIEREGLLARLLHSDYAQFEAMMPVLSPAIIAEQKRLYTRLKEIAEEEAREMAAEEKKQVEATKNPGISGSSSKAGL